MKYHPRNWQHIYLLSRALMLIWEKLHSEANGKNKKWKKDFSKQDLAGQKKKMSHTQNTLQLIRIILHCSTSRLQLQCLVWFTAYHGMRGWRKPDRVRTCVRVRASEHLQTLCSFHVSFRLSGRKQGVTENVLIRSCTKTVLHHLLLHATYLYVSHF